MNNKISVNNCFWAGWAFCIAFISIAQDLIGQESYIYLIQNYWISAWISIPIMLVIMLAWGMILRREMMKEVNDS